MKRFDFSNTKITPEQRKKMLISSKFEDIRFKEKINAEFIPDKSTFEINSKKIKEDIDGLGLNIE